jgi:hypothetical protein
MPVPFLNQTTGQLEYYDQADITPEALPLLAARGLRQATPEDVANRERTLEFSSVGQQALAQAERVVRGATLGQFEGIGSDEDIRARAEVSEEVSPVLSLAADFAPDVGLGILTGGGSALLTTAGRTAAKGLGRAALSAAAKAAPRAALAGEAVAGGLVTASQQAFSEGRQFFHENPVEDATNTLLWSGIGGVLAGAPQAFRALKATGKAGKAAAEVADEAELAAARAAGEANAVPMPASAGPSTTGVPLTSDEGTQAAYEASLGLEARPIVNKPDMETVPPWKPSTKGFNFEELRDLPSDVKVKEIARRVREQARWRQSQEGAIRLGERENAETGVPAAKLHGMLPQAPMLEQLAPEESALLELDKLSSAVNRAVTRLSDTEKDALHAYTGAWYSEIRSGMRGEAVEGGGIRAKYAAMAPAVKDAADKLRVRNITNRGPLFRGMPASQKMLDDLMNQDELVTDSITSASFEPTVARSFTTDGNPGDVPVILKIEKADEGVPLLSSAATVTPGEAEVLLPPGSKFAIKRREALPDGGFMFTLHQIGKANEKELRALSALGVVAALGGAVESDDSGGAAMAGIGLLGAALGKRGLMGKGARAVAEESSERLASKDGKALIAAERGVAKAERNAVRSQADDIVRKAVKGEEPLGRADGFLRDSRLAQYQPEIIDVATKEMRNDLNELNRLSQGIRERAVKQEDVAKNIADNLPAQQAKARDIALAGQRLAGEMRIEAQQLGQQLGKKGPAYFSGTARDLVSSIIERTEAISHMSNGAEIFNALDDLKRVVDNHKVALESGARKSTKDPIRYQELVPKVEAFAHQIRASLEDVPTFGRAGEMQKAYNATYHQKWFPAKQVFEESVFKRTGRDYKAFDTLDAWESKVTGLLENAGTGERRHVTDMLGALREMAEQRAKFGTASKAETDRISSLVDKIERTFKLADDTNAAKGRLETLMPVAQAAGGAIGAGVGGLAGAIIGGSVAKGAAELATGKYRRAFMAMRGATEETVERSVDDWIQVSKGRAAVSGAKRSRFPKVELTPENRHLLKTAKRMGVTFGFAEFLGDNNDPQSAFSTKRDALLDDEGFVNRFADEFGDLAQEEPQVYAVAAGKAGEIRKFLLDRLPSSVAVSMARPNGYPPTNEAIEDWSVYWNAATNPRSVVQSMSRGDIRPQEVETLRTLYRPLYEKLQGTLIDRISNATNMGDDLDDQFVMRMSLLFDLDGAGTPAFSQRAANVARQVTPVQPPQQGKPFAPKVGTRVSPSNVAINGPTYGTVG